MINKTSVALEIFQNDEITPETFILSCAESVWAGNNRENLERQIKFHRNRVTVNTEDLRKTEKYTLEEIKEVSKKYYKTALQRYETHNNFFSAKRKRIKEIRDFVEKFKPKNKDLLPFRKFLIDVIENSIKILEERERALLVKPVLLEGEKWRADRIRMLKGSTEEHQRLADEMQETIDNISAWETEFLLTLEGCK